MPSKTMGRDLEFTPRQREVLDLLVRGQSNAEIAATLGISLDGAKWHVREILQKLGADSREEAADYWRRQHGLRPRLWRVARALFGLPAWMKWAAGGSALAAAVVVGLLFALPGSNSPANSTAIPPSPTAGSPSSTPTPPPAAPFPGLYPHGTTTGIPIVDRATAAVTSGDGDTVFALARYFFTPCVAQVDYRDSDQLSSVCAPDMAPGTVLSGYFSGPCGPGWVDRDHFNIEGGGPAQMTHGDVYLFAVLRAHATPDFATNEAYAATRYIAIFQSPGYADQGGLQGARAIAIGDDGIPLVSPRCSYDARGMLDHLIGFETDGYVLPPRDGAIHRDLPPTYGPGVPTGVASVDEAVNTILSGKPLTDDQFHWVPEPCSSNPPAIGGTPQCPAGTPDGTPVGRILVGGCEPGALARDAGAPTGIAGQQPGEEPPRLYAITRTAAADQVDGQYVAIFVDVSDLSFRPAYMGIDDEGIVSIFTGACRANAVAWAAGQPGFLLAPGVS